MSKTPSFLRFYYVKKKKVIVKTMAGKKKLETTKIDTNTITYKNLNQVI